ncbi:WYL domain-containing protein [Myxococcota bacterium]|nr:WYL domain-containing protein [Myxococcota bacterium]
MERVAGVSARSTGETDASGRRSARLVDLLITLYRGGAPGPRVLADTFGVSAATLRKDLALLRQRLGWPLTWDPSSGSWRLGGDATPLHLPPGTSLVLSALTRSLAAHGHGPLQTASALIASAVEASVDQELRSAFGAMVSNARPDLLEQLGDAIRHRDRLCIEYRSRSRARRLVRAAFDPEGFEFVDRHLYIIGVRVDRLLRVAHRVDRIERVQRMGMRLGKPLAVRDVRGPVANRVGIWGGPTVTEVTCIASRTLADLIRAEPACLDFTFRPLTPMEVELVFRVSHVEAFVRWSMRWMDGLTVISPPDVVASVRALLAAAGERHAAIDDDPPLR